MEAQYAAFCSPTWVKVGLVVMSILGGVANGFNIHVINAVLPRLRDDIGTEPAAESWVAASMWVGMICGLVLTVLLSNMVGRKPIMGIGEAIIGILAPLQVVAASGGSFGALRMLLGVGVGICATTKPLYVAEVAGARLRGTFVAVFVVSYSVGFNIAYVADLDEEVSWQVLVGTGGLPAALLLLLIFFMPESPVWLEMVAEGKRAKLSALGASGGQPSTDSSDTLVSAREEGAPRTPTTDSSGAATTGQLGRTDGPCECCKTVVSLCIEPLTRRAFLSALALMAGYQLLGGAVYTTMTSILFDIQPTDGVVSDAIMAHLNGTATIAQDKDHPPGQVSNRAQQTMASTCHLGGGIVGLLIVDRVNRRPQVLVLHAISVTALVIAAVLRAALPAQDAWFYAICAYIFSWTAGIANAFWAIVSEIFPPRARVVGMATTLFFFNLSSTILTATVQPVLVEGCPLSVLFGAFATIGLVTLLIIWWYLPETNGVPISEITDVLKRSAGASNAGCGGGGGGEGDDGENAAPHPFRS